MHNIEIDQSGRTDVLTVDSVLAFSDGIQRAILIPKSVKHVCYQRLKTAGLRKDLIAVKLFMAGLILLLTPALKEVHLIIIDQEYPGWENAIKEHLLRYLRRKRPVLSNRQVVFGHIGKRSNAHKIALATCRGKMKPDKRIKIEELAKVMV